MEKPIIIVTKLEGAVSGNVKHTTKQRHTCQIDIGTISKMIDHTDRIPCECTRRTSISSEVVSFWTSDTCPEWENPRKWKSMSDHQRLVSHVIRFDEGFGVTFELIQ